MLPAKNPSANNQLLAALPRKDYQALDKHLEEVPLVFDAVIYRRNVLVSDVYFPNSGIVSLLAGADERSTLEVGMVGSEGMVGLGVFLGVDDSHNSAVVQGAGTAMKMKASALRRECQNGSALPRILQRYTHSLITQITQAAICNQFHALEARLARWLLMMHDRLDGDGFQVTQNFLSNMLGVRREGVSLAASNLQKLDLIGYSRGRLKILDRAGLEAKSCGCYDIIKTESNGFFGKV